MIEKKHKIFVYIHVFFSLTDRPTDQVIYKLDTNEETSPKNQTAVYLNLVLLKSTKTYQMIDRRTHIHTLRYRIS